MGNTSKLRGKAEILSEIYVSAEVETMIRSLKPQHLQDDIKQHCFLELFEKPEAFIMDLHDRGKLKAYICKTMYNTARFTRTSFAKEQGKEILFSDLAPDDEEDSPIEQFADPGTDNDFENIEVDLSKLHWYKREMLKLSAGIKNCPSCQTPMATDAEECLKCGKTNDHKYRCKTYQSISDFTHIPMTSVYQTVLETRKQILKEYHESQRR